MSARCAVCKGLGTIVVRDYVAGARVEARRPCACAAARLSKVELDALRAIVATEGRPAVSSTWLNRTERLGLAAYDKWRDRWALTATGRTALAEAQ